MQCCGCHVQQLHRNLVCRGAGMANAKALSLLEHVISAWVVQLFRVLHCTACPARASLLHDSCLEKPPHAVSSRASFHASVQLASNTAGCLLVKPGGLRHKAAAQEDMQGMLSCVTLRAASTLLLVEPKHAKR